MQKLKYVSTVPSLLCPYYYSACQSWQEEGTQKDEEKIGVDCCLSVENAQRLCTCTDREAAAGARGGGGRLQEEAEAASRRR